VKSSDIKVWVLFGGPSREREVSIKSGNGIAKALKSKGYVVEAFDVQPGPAIHSLNWAQPPDIVFLGLHGTWGEDGVIQGFLESLKIPYVGSDVQASVLSFHKGLSKMLMSAAGIPVPFSYSIKGLDSFQNMENSGNLSREFFSNDWYLKPAREGSTIGIERFRGTTFKGSSARSEFYRLLNLVLEFDQDVLIEEWIEGPELTVPVLNGKALPVVEIRPDSKFYDYSSKYTVGKTQYFCPAPLSMDDTLLCQSLAEKTFRCLSCLDYGRVDIMLGKNGPKVLEMNTLPGMTETSLVPKSAMAAGLDYATFLDVLLKSSMERQRASQ